MTPLCDKLKQGLCRQLLRASEKEIRKSILGAACGEKSNPSGVIRSAILEALQISPARSREDALEIIRQPNQAPQVKLKDELQRIAEEKEIRKWAVSLSHDGAYCIALTVGVPFGKSTVGAGIDLIFKKRMEGLIDKEGGLNRFMGKFLHPRERARLGEDESTANHLSRIWTLKEAAYKAIPLPKPHFFVSVRDIIVSADLTKPEIFLDERFNPSGNETYWITQLEENDDAVIAGTILIATPGKNRNQQQR